jgi:AraC-like DNA-binding protein
MPRQSPDNFVLPRIFWTGCFAMFGLAPDAVLRHARLPASLYLQEKAWISTAEFFALMRAVEQLSDFTLPGLQMAKKLKPAILPTHLIASTYARDLRDCLARQARFARLSIPQRMNVADDGIECVVTFDWLYPQPDEPAMLTDAAFSKNVEVARLCTGREIRPLRVELKRADDGSGTHAAYFGCPVIFGAKRNALVYASADLDLPFPGHNPDLLAMLEPQLVAALAAVEAQQSISDQVKAVIKRQLASGRPELADIARELGMSERTLQRRITEQGRNYRQLLAEARQELVRQLLRDCSQIETSEIAVLTGYEDTNSFYRAFRSWEGTTPARWRESQAAVTSPH